RPVTDRELAADLELEVASLQEMDLWNRPPVSFDAPLPDDYLSQFPTPRSNTATCASDLVDEDAPNGWDHALIIDLTSSVQAILSGLNEREEKVMRLRFSLNDGVSRTLSEIGEIFEVTRERIRQIQSQTLKTLRTPEFSVRLEGYLE